uniref:Uncharacterized protein n=1 Tax=Arundo donax TaxID=35708 RepID=A0A0A9I1A2_ARUDO
MHFTKEHKEGDITNCGKTVGSNSSSVTNLTAIYFKKVNSFVK